MSILQKIGASIKSLLGQPKEATVDKTEVLTTIETLLQTAVSVKESLQRPEVIKALSVMHETGVKDLQVDVKHLQKVYNIYFHTLPAKWQQAERDTVFKSFNVASEIVQTNLVLLRDHFAEVFGGVDSADLKLSELTVSMAAALGWLENVDRYFNWIIYFIGNIAVAGDRVPPYQMIWIDKHTETVAQYTLSLLSQSRNETILTTLEEMRRKGADLHLETDGHTIDTYASDTHYSPEVLNALNGFRGPILMIGTAVNVYRQWRYESMKVKREWIASKVGYLTLQAQGLDPNSAEAKRLQAITTRYAEMVAQYDKKLGVGSDV